MKILVFGDSHGMTKGIADTMQKLHKSVSSVIHLGDGYNDMLDAINMYPELDYYRVAGNCDFFSEELEQQIIETEGQRIFITHGHTYGVKISLKEISKKAKELHADVCLFGHTHIPISGYYEDILMLNPGSIGLPKGPHRASYGIIDISARGVITGSVVEITPHGNRPIEFYSK